MDSGVELRPTRIFGYFITPDGQVWSNRKRGKYVEGQTGPLMKMKGKIDRYGYPVFILSDNNKRHYLCAHTLVLEAFVGPKPAGMQACHNDGNKKNNHYTNLRWDTASSNQQDKKSHGTDCSGEKQYGCKLTEAIVYEILRQLGLGVTQKALAKKYGVCQSHISEIKLGKKWKHIKR